MLILKIIVIVLMCTCCVWAFKVSCDEMFGKKGRKDEDNKPV